MKIREYIHKDFLSTNKRREVWFKGTPGVGDFMYALNIAYLRSYITGKQIKLRFFWFHKEDFLFHFEDPETIIERLHYIEKFYRKKGTDVVIEHEFESKNYKIWHDRFYHYDRKMKKTDPRLYDYKHNDWVFNDAILNSPTMEDKIVLWRPTFNAQPPRHFKNPFTNFEWAEIIDMIREFHGYRVVELDYRTPISEVLYHIRTCKMTISYEGMWHYIAKNCRKPMVVICDDPITRVHTPDALIYNPRERKGFDPANGDKPVYKVEYFHNFEKRIRLAKKYSKRRLGYLEDMFNEDR